MRQAVILEPTDFAALKAGTPLTLQVGGVELLLMTRSETRDRQAVEPASNGTRRRYTDPQRRRLLAEYEKHPAPKTGWLRRHHLSSSMIFQWRQRYKKDGR